MSKMGISTVASYTGAQVFEAIGLGQELVDEYFTGTTSRLGGVGLDVHRRGGRGPPPVRVPGPAERARPPGAEDRRRVPVAPGGRVPPLQPRDRLQAAARDPVGPLRDLQAVHADGGRPGEAARHVAGPVRTEGRRASVDPDRGGRAGQRDREAVLDRGDELRLHLGRGAPDARDRDEPARREVQHRGGRRGRRPFHARRQRRPAAERDQAGGEWPLRRDERVPRERRRPPDQDGPGREARRGRPAARAQGVPVDRPDAALDARVSA